MNDSLWYLLIGGTSSIISRTTTSPIGIISSTKTE